MIKQKSKLAFSFNWLLSFIANNWIFLFPLFACGFAIFLAVAYAKWFPSLNALLNTQLQFRDAPAWGQLGDFMGGILNPLISLLTLLVAVFVWKLQKQELKESRAAIKQQTTDQLFMGMLAAHRSMVEQVTLVKTDIRASLQTGKHAIQSYLRMLDAPRDALAYALTIYDEYETISLLQTETASVFPVFKIPGKQSVGAFASFCAKYYSKELWTPYFRADPNSNELSFEHIFGHIFRSTYQILKLIDTEFDSSKDLEDLRIKKRYVNLLRAQMSESEFIFFAMSAITDDGKKSWARSVRLNFFEGRLQNTEWTRDLRVLFDQTEDNLIEARKILDKDGHAD
jgi:Putative phage abortive infection protein